MKLLDVFRIINESQFLIERDVYNAKELKQWAKDSAARLTDPQAATWYASQLFKYLINRYEDGLRTAQFDAQAPDWVMAKLDAGERIYTVEPQQQLRQEAEQVIDWLNSATAAENGNINLRMTWEDAVEAQAEWHKDMARQSRVTELTAEQLEGIVTIMEFDDGFRWVDVQTDVCLKHEGTVMGHCVGGGGYTAGVQAGTTKILSLRDGNNNPHATIEGESKHPIHINKDMLNSGQADLFVDNALEQSFVDMEIHQIKGKENRPVVRKYRDYVLAFLTKFQIEKFGHMGLYDLEGSGLFKLHDYGFAAIEDVGTEMAKMNDGTSWHRVNNDEVVLRDYNTQLAAKWFLHDKAGRSIDDLVEKEDGIIYSIGYKLKQAGTKYKEHIQKAFDTGVKPDSGLTTNWDSSLHSFDLGVRNGKVGEPQTIGVHKGDTVAGPIYATERGATDGDIYWLMSGDKVQSQFILHKLDEGLGYHVYFNKAHGLPNGSMPTFLKQFEAMFPKVNINNIIVQDRNIAVNEMEWEPEKGDELIMEEDGVKFYKTAKGWYNAIDSHNQLIFNMHTGNETKDEEFELDPTRPDGSTITSPNFKVKMVNDTKVAGYYAVYLLEHLEAEEDLDIGDYTNYASFAREFLDETDWFQSDYRRGGSQLSQAQNIWMVMDETFPIHLTVEYGYDDDSEETVYDEDTIMKTFWTETSLYDSGMEVDYFAKEYDQVYTGGNTGWDDEHDGYDQEGAGPEHTRTDYYVEGKGDENTVMHPISGGSMRIQK